MTSSPNTSRRLDAARRRERDTQIANVRAMPENEEERFSHLRLLKKNSDEFLDRIFVHGSHMTQGPGIDQGIGC